MKKYYHTFALLCCVTLLSACGNKAVEQVKNVKLQSNSSYTVGQAYDNRNVCDDITWSNYTDDKDRTIVEYRCEIKGFKDYAKKSLEQQLLNIESQKQSALEKSNTNIAELNEAIERLNTIISEVQKERDRFATAKNFDDLTFILKTISSTEETSTSKITQNSAWHSNLLNWCVNSANRDQDSYCKNSLSNIDDYLKKLNTEVQKYKNGIELNHQAITTISTNAENEVSKYSNSLIFTGDQAFEIQKWVVSEDEVSFIGAILEYKSGDKEEPIDLYDIQKVESAILDNEVKEYISYIQYILN